MAEEKTKTVIKTYVALKNLAIRDGKGVKQIKKGSKFSCSDKEASVFARVKAI